MALPLPVRDASHDQRSPGPTAAVTGVAEADSDPDSRGAASVFGTSPTKDIRSGHDSEGVAYAAVITEEVAEAALAAVENRRVQYTDTQLHAMKRISQVAPELGRMDLHLRASLILADFELRRGDTIGSAERVKDILATAERIGDTFVMARSHFLLCDIHHSLGDSPSARISGIRAVELLPDDAPLGVRIDHLRALGTAYGPGPDANRVNARALDLTNVIGDAERAIGIHNSYAYFAFEVGDALSAREHALQMLELSRRRDIPLVASQLDTVARMLMMFGRHEAALDLLRPLVPQAGDPTRTGGVPDIDPKPYGLPECVLTVAEAHRALGRYATAQAALRVAVHWAEERHLRRFRSRVHLAQARLFAEIGDWPSAYAEHVAFHDVVRELRSTEMETRARIIQASYDEDEKRRDAEDFRDLAMRDALTGLYNRRFLDESLRTLAARAGATGNPISVAIADADFFKRINDELSHEVGDEVLRTLASLLAAAVRTPEVVGRLGGEEFLILFPDTNVAAALARADEIRRVIDDYDFSTVTGSIPVTVSIGCATSYDGRSAPSEMLAAADHNLYAAKRSGRNRVMGPSQK